MVSGAYERRQEEGGRADGEHRSGDRGGRRAPARGQLQSHGRGAAFVPPASLPEDPEQDRPGRSGGDGGLGGLLQRAGRRDGVRDDHQEGGRSGAHPGPGQVAGAASRRADQAAAHHDHGHTNVGKSTLMNALLKKRVAKVGDEPAVTKQQQKLYLGKNTILVDTPGMLWPKIALPSDGLMLAASHAIGSNALIEEEVAVFLADELLKRYPALLATRYGFKEIAGMDGIAVVEGVAAKRGFRQKGGDLDFEKASHTFLGDYRSGILGRISLETPETRSVLLAEHAAEMAAKAEKAAALAAEKAKAAANGKRGT